MYETFTRYSKCANDGVEDLPVYQSCQLRTMYAGTLGGVG